MITVKVDKKVVKAIKVKRQCNFIIPKLHACSVQSADIFARALLSVLLQNSLKHLKEDGDVNIGLL